MIKRNKIKYDKQGTLLDVRFQKDIKGYAEWQAGNRQRNTELLEFERMKKHYAGREEEMPYKTLAGFKRARRAEDLSPAFKAWRNKKIDQNTFDRWQTIQDFRNCPKTLEDLQKIKYNKDTANWELLKRERKTISDINSKDWTDTFRDKAIDTYYHFREKGIEFTDHGIARFLQRGISFEKVVEFNRKPFNYKQEDQKSIKFYNKLAIIYTQDETQIVSVIERKTIKGDWHEIKN